MTQVIIINGSNDAESLINNNFISHQFRIAVSQRGTSSNAMIIFQPTAPCCMEMDVFPSLTR